MRHAGDPPSQAGVRAEHVRPAHCDPDRMPRAMNSREQVVAPTTWAGLSKGRASIGKAGAPGLKFLQNIARAIRLALALANTIHRSGRSFTPGTWAKRLAVSPNPRLPGTARLAYRRHTEIPAQV